jgi:hypothetical protein
MGAPRFLPAPHPWPFVLERPPAQLISPRPASSLNRLSPGRQPHENRKMKNTCYSCYFCYPAQFPAENQPETNSTATVPSSTYQLPICHLPATALPLQSRPAHRMPVPFRPRGGSSPHHGPIRRLEGPMLGLVQRVPAGVGLVGAAGSLIRGESSQWPSWPMPPCKPMTANVSTAQPLDQSTHCPIDPILTAMTAVTAVTPTTLMTPLMIFLNTGAWAPIGSSQWQLAAAAPQARGIFDTAWGACYDAGRSSACALASRALFM